MEEVPIIGVGKQRFVSRFARFRQHGSSDAYRPAHIVEFQHLTHGKEEKCRITVHALDRRETIHDGDFEILPARPEEFSGKLCRFHVLHKGLGCCETLDEVWVNGELHLKLYSKKHGVTAPVPISELTFIQSAI